MNKYYLSIKIDEVRNASSKAVNDCNHILEKNGFKPYYLNILKDASPLRKKAHNYLEINKITKIKKDSIVVLPHPIYLNKRYIDIVKKAKEKQNLHLVFLIHDLEIIRNMFPDAYEDFKYIDLTMLEIADDIIVHNKKMKEYLENKNVKANLHVLEVFDYLCQPNHFEKKYANSLIIAGNLDTKKSSYIKELKDIKDETIFNLYGVNFDETLENSKNIKYFGSFPPDEIQLQFNEGFGLVWDGNTIETCDGNTGKYLKYNNPHKLSLYLASGLPVVIWSQAAEAQFVLNNGVGLVVDNIKEFNFKFNNLSIEQYNKMVNNAVNISKKLHEGYYLTKILKEVVLMYEK